MRTRSSVFLLLLLPLHAVVSVDPKPPPPASNLGVSSRLKSPLFPSFLSKNRRFPLGDARCWPRRLHRCDVAHERVAAPLQFHSNMHPRHAPEVPQRTLHCSLAPRAPGAPSLVVCVAGNPPPSRLLKRLKLFFSFRQITLHYSLNQTRSAILTPTLDRPGGQRTHPSRTAPRRWFDPHGCKFPAFC